jgi:hypothetical protein
MCGPSGSRSRLSLDDAGGHERVRKNGRRAFHGCGVPSNCIHFRMLTSVFLFGRRPNLASSWPPRRRCPIPRSHSRKCKHALRSRREQFSRTPPWVACLFSGGITEIACAPSLPRCSARVICRRSSPPVAPSSKAAERYHPGTTPRDGALAAI